LWKLVSHYSNTSLFNSPIEFPHEIDFKRESLSLRWVTSLLLSLITSTQLTFCNCYFSSNMTLLALNIQSLPRLLFSLLVWPLDLCTTLCIAPIPKLFTLIVIFTPSASCNILLTHRFEICQLFLHWNLTSATFSVFLVINQLLP